MLAVLQELNQHFIDLWWESSEDIPDLGPAYTSQEQTQNENSLLHFMDQLERTLSNPPRGPQEVRSARLRLGAELRCLAEQALGIPAAQLDLLPSEAFSQAAEDFVRRARAFDPGLSVEDIYQAGRNAWTAHGLQWLLGRPVELTSSILGYSLLYPYTDNLLDDPEISSETKLSFNERLGQRLAGRPLPPLDAREKVIFELVGMIEGQYPRADNPAVYESLLAIQDAQVRSLDLQRHVGVPGEVDVLGLSFYKGGTSVMADGYLAGGSLTDVQRRYAYGQGTLAQLLDDLEDVEQDSRAGLLTIFSQPAGQSPLDAQANRALQFGRGILMGLDCFDVAEPVRDLIQRGTNLLLVDAIGRTGRYYTPAYLHTLEAHSPFRFSFLQEQRSALLRRHGSPLKLVKALAAFGNF